MTKQQTIEHIAREFLDLETLETRRMDSLDFKEQAVWSIAKALDAAYEAGRLVGRAGGRGTNDGPGFCIGQRVRVVGDGPSPEHDLVLQGRLSGQAPEVDPVVVFTDCDPADMPPGTFLDAEIVDAAGYDLIVRPV